MSNSFSKPITVRQCLIWALPAFLVALVLRAVYLHAIPEALFNGDTPSFMHMGVRLFDQGEISIYAKRRWVYPIFLIFLHPFPGSLAQTTALVQHLLGAFMLTFGVAWIIGNITRFWKFWVPPLTLLMAIWPNALAFEHVIGSENLLISCMILTIGLALPLQKLKENRTRLFWFLFSLTITCGIRPQGRALWFVAMLLVFLVVNKNPLLWGAKNIVMAIICAAVALTTGTDKLGGRLLLSSVLPLVQTEGAKYAEVRQALVPAINDARKYGDDYPWVQKYYKVMIRDGSGLLDTREFHKLGKKDVRFTKALKALSYEAILSHPVQFSRFTLKKFFIASSKEMADPLISLDAANRFDPEAFWDGMAAANRPHWKKNPADFKLVFEMSKKEFEAMVAERRTRTYPFLGYVKHLNRDLAWLEAVPPSKSEAPSKAFAAFSRESVKASEAKTSTSATNGEDVLDGGEAASFRVNWITWFVIVGFLVCLTPWYCKQTLLLWLTTFLYLGISFAVGDRVPRFILPLEWIWFCFVFIALDGIARLLCFAFRGWKKPTAPSREDVSGPCPVA